MMTTTLQAELLVVVWFDDQTHPAELFAQPATDNKRTAVTIYILALQKHPRIILQGFAQHGANGLTVGEFHLISFHESRRFTKTKTPMMTTATTTLRTLIPVVSFSSG